jgi:Na+/melibiose symporter-like transporter
MNTAAAPDTRGRVLRYGAMGLPLAFVALPLYVQWPAYAAAQWGMALATLGALLLLVRMADALIDPWIGRQADHWFSNSPRAPWWGTAVACAVLCVGFVGLFFAPAALLRHEGPRLPVFAWAVGALLLTYLGYSVAQVVHQAWAARLGGSATQRARWVGAREAFALTGVLVASVLPGLAGWAVTAGVLATMLALALWALKGVPTGHAAGPVGPAGGRTAGAIQLRANDDDPARPGRTRGDVGSPWRVKGFRSLLAVHLLNGLAAAIPASLVLFFIRDRVQASPAFEAAFLAAYFGAAALGVPAWVRVVGRIGLVRAWGAGMLLSILAFGGAVAVGAGDAALYLAICAASGLALGADLVAPAALLAGIIQRSPAQGRDEGRWFGWWSMAGKLNLALAAGVALPLVQVLGYAPGARDAGGLLALALVYAVVPCLVKLAALALLWGRQDDWADAVDREAR